MNHDGAILDKLVEQLRRWGPSWELYCSVPVDLWRKALRRVRAK